MPRDKPKRWEVQETIKVLMFLNGNFELWYKTPFVACVRAIEATNIMREGKQVYNKVHGLIQDMEKYLDTGKKANNAIIWENQEIHNLVRNLCVNAREKKRNENQEIPSRAIDGDEMNMDQESVTSEGSSNQNDVNRDIPRINFTIGDVNNIYDEKRQKLEKLRDELIEAIGNANKKFEDFKNFQ
ncbi:hypothetical protein RclHR1_06680008 [Rhizophagus clarus]|uniref:Uncharacterized protein n=1 Tax=Rhizophagus clarus TaxID=94130 RepID=A0A2Z6SAP5_9GLOM|nr:hypothetical protein RclHR1_06680008 [Rhizophagus clarus]